MEVMRCRAWEGNVDIRLLQGQDRGICRMLTSIYHSIAIQFVHGLCDQGCNAHHQVFGYHFSVHLQWCFA
jgi:hypothetical protein